MPLIKSLVVLYRRLRNQFLGIPEPTRATQNGVAAEVGTEPPETLPASTPPSDEIPEHMVFVKGGTFLMGSCKDEADATFVHTVTVGDFYISKYQITQAEWRQVMGSDPSYFKGCDQCPVESVSWNEVQAFLRQLNAQTGWNYRLPTEAEWEYAARGGPASCSFTYAGGNEVDAVAWYDGNSERTHPVGQKIPNALGLFDMSGNVWEWCLDWYDYKNREKSFGKNSFGPASHVNRILRGGSWNFDRAPCRVEHFSSFNPEDSNYDIGFRVAMSPYPSTGTI